MDENFEDDLADAVMYDFQARLFMLLTLLFVGTGLLCLILTEMFFVSVILIAGGVVSAIFAGKKRSEAMEAMPEMPFAKGADGDEWTEEDINDFLESAEGADGSAE